MSTAAIQIASIVPQTTGILLNPQNGLPLSGVTVQALVTLPTGATQLLGQSVSDAGGRFSIALSTPGYTLKVLAASGAAYPFTVDVGGRLLVTLPATVLSPRIWPTVGQRMLDTGIFQLNELVRELVAPAARSVFGDWSLEQRHAAVSVLEEAFLDPQAILKALGPVPTFVSLAAPDAMAAYRRRLEAALTDPVNESAVAGLESKVAAFAHFASVDWMVDVPTLAKGQVADAIAMNQTTYSVPYKGTPGPPKDQNLNSYRNYLRAIFTGPPQDPAYQQRLQSLRTRFHQDFATTITASQAANNIGIRLMLEVLSAPVNAGYGFGIPANQITPQGTLRGRQYLDYLISLTKVSASELSLRYRFDLTLPDSAQSGPVQENISTLQGFYQDGFQAGGDPFPIIPPSLLGKPPFFLEYDEWLARNAPFYAENYFPLRQTMDIGVEPDVRANIRSAAKASNADPFIVWFDQLLHMDEQLQAGYKKFDAGEYAQAAEYYRSASDLADSALPVDFQLQNGSLTKQPKSLDAAGMVKAAEPWLTYAREAKVTETGNGANGLGLHVATYVLRYDAYNITFPQLFWNDVHDQYPKERFALLHAYVYVIGVAYGDLAMALGDYEAAVDWYGLLTGFVLAHAGGDRLTGYDNLQTNNSIYNANPSSNLYQDGNLPYSADVSKNRKPDFTVPFGGTYLLPLAQLLIPGQANPTDQKFYELRHGMAMLEWADALYRSGESGSVLRARELYKAVLFLHGAPPGITPMWSGLMLLAFAPKDINPALASQIARARQGLEQIDAGANYFGYTDDYVPPVRYVPLKAAADRYAALAKTAQQDLLAAVTQIEESERNAIQLENLIQKASLQFRMAQEQQQNALIDLDLANRQVNQIEAAIKAKADEVAKHADFGQQLLDWGGSFVGTLASLPKSMTDGLDAAPAGLGLAEGSASTTGGAFGAGGWMGLGAGAAGAAGFGVFVYAGISAVVAIGDAENLRMADLKTLTEVALPLAQQQFDARQHTVNITLLQQQLALADADLARELLHFEVVRSLNPEFWASVAVVLRRLMRRYLDLGARHAWLAQRALEYEQDRTIGIVRMDYFPSKLYGITGADLLQLDIGELEAARLSAIRPATPVKYTYSLAFDFPFAFAQLKKTGRCEIHTEEAPLHAAYPGVYGYRVRAISVAVQNSSDVGPPRGLLTNTGISSISRPDGTSHTSVRQAEGFPLSEFRLMNDMAVYSLPDEALLNFEGSGVDSFWTLEFSAVANPYGLSALADVQITFDLTSHFSYALYQAENAAPATAVRRSILVSARKWSPGSIQSLAGGAASVQIPFDMAALLPLKESNRVVQNMVLLAVSAKPLDFTASLANTAGSVSAVSVPVTQGIAVSNAPPLGQAQPPAPLNAFIGKAADQTFQLTIAKGNVDFSGVVDVVFGLDYTANVP